MENQNIIEEIAKMKSVEIGEHFIIAGCDGKSFSRNNPYHFRKDGLYDCNGDESSYAFMELIKGTATIKRRFWKPKNHDKYHFVDVTGLQEIAYFSDEYITDVINYKLGNCFRTEEELSDNKESILSLLKSDEIFK